MILRSLSIAPLTGASEDVAQAALDLYWQAFAPKLGRILGPQAKAHAVMRRGLDLPHALGAFSGAGELCGVVGFRDPAGAFIDLSPAALIAVHGPISGRLRALALQRIGSYAPQGAVMVDGIAVRPDLRGQGIGQALLAALSAKARASGSRALCLDVADSNLRAQALYARLGFRPTGVQQLGALGALVGFSSLTSMELRLA